MSDIAPTTPESDLFAWHRAFDAHPRCELLELTWDDAFDAPDRVRWRDRATFVEHTALLEAPTNIIAAWTLVVTTPPGRVATATRVPLTFGWTVRHAAAEVVTALLGGPRPGGLPLKDDDR